MFNEVALSTESIIQIYTDASKDEAGTDPAVILQNTKQYFKLNIRLQQNISKITQYTSKYMTILKIIKITIMSEMTEIDICSNSLSAISNLKKNVLTDPLALKISNIIYQSNKE